MVSFMYETISKTKQASRSLIQILLCRKWKGSGRGVISCATVYVLFECVLVPSFSSDSPTHSLKSHCRDLLKFRDSNKSSPRRHKLRILSLGISLFFLLLRFTISVAFATCWSFWTPHAVLYARTQTGNTIINYMQEERGNTWCIILSAQCVRPASSEDEEDMSLCEYNKVLPDLRQFHDLSPIGQIPSSL
jgi:hypothetical protein